MAPGGQNSSWAWLSASTSYWSLLIRLPAFIASGDWSKPSAAVAVPPETIPVQHLRRKPLRDQGTDVFKLGAKPGHGPDRVASDINGEVVPTGAVISGLAKELHSDPRYLEKLAEEIRKDINVKQPAAGLRFPGSPAKQNGEGVMLLAVAAYLLIYQCRYVSLAGPATRRRLA
jgi:hypothetical protein